MKWWKKISRMLEQADLPLRTAELYYIQIGTGLLVGTIAALVWAGVASSRWSRS